MPSLKLMHVLSSLELSHRSLSCAFIPLSLECSGDLLCGARCCLKLVTPKLSGRFLGRHELLVLRSLFLLLASPSLGTASTVAVSTAT